MSDYLQLKSAIVGPDGEPFNLIKDDPRCLQEIDEVKVTVDRSDSIQVLLTVTIDDPFEMKLRTFKDLDLFDFLASDKSIF